MAIPYVAQPLPDSGSQAEYGRRRQAILRHANVATTQAFYIKTAPADAHLAMQRLEKVLGSESWATVWATTAGGHAG